MCTPTFNLGCECVHITLFLSDWKVFTICQILMAIHFEIFLQDSFTSALPNAKHAILKMKSRQLVHLYVVGSSSYEPEQGCLQMKQATTRHTLHLQDPLCRLVTRHEFRRYDTIKKVQYRLDARCVCRRKSPTTIKHCFSQNIGALTYHCFAKLKPPSP